MDTERPPAVPLLPEDEDLTRTLGWCPNCHLAYRLGEPPTREFYAIAVDPTTFTFMLAAAREFDETAQELTPGESFTAVDFLDWLKPVLVARDPVSLDEKRRRAGVA